MISNRYDLSKMLLKLADFFHLMLGHANWLFAKDMAALSKRRANVFKVEMDGRTDHQQVTGIIPIKVLESRKAFNPPRFKCASAWTLADVRVNGSNQAASTNLILVQKTLKISRTVTTYSTESYTNAFHE